MLYYSPQIWCSDNTDSLTRIRIQYGTSVAYPARSIGAHISPVPNHITGNATSLRTGALVAMCGTFGVELILPTLTPKELSALKRQIEVYKEVSHIIYWGDIYRLWDPFKVEGAALMSVSGQLMRSD
jgi:alpha-galactosidase